MSILVDTTADEMGSGPSKVVALDRVAG